MKTDGIVLHTSALPPAASRLLREGSSVFVRILRSLGGGRYSASFCGGVYSIKSEQPLAEGFSFSARIKADGKTVLLVRGLEGGAESSAASRIDGAFGNAGAASNPALSAYFKRLGLLPDNLSLALYREMRQLGMRFDGAAMGRARAVAKKFYGREKSAAEAALILERKGLRADGRTVQKILGGWQEWRGERNRKERGGRGFCEFFSEMLSGREGTVPGENPGALALFNHTGFSSGAYRAEGNWICIPFDFSYRVSEECSDGGMRHGTGAVRIFMRPNMHSAEKAALSLAFSQKKYDFILHMKSGRCTEILVAPPSGTLAEESAVMASSMQERLGVPVVLSEWGADDAFPAGQDAIVLAGGFA